MLEAELTLWQTRSMAWNNPPAPPQDTGTFPALSRTHCSLQAALKRAGNGAWAGLCAGCRAILGDYFQTPGPGDEARVHKGSAPHQSLLVTAQGLAS